MYWKKLLEHRFIEGLGGGGEEEDMGLGGEDGEFQWPLCLPATK